MNKAAMFSGQPASALFAAALIAGCVVLAPRARALNTNVAAPALAPLPLTLPPPTTKGTPPDNPPSGPSIEPLDLTKERPPFMAPAGVTNLALRKPVLASDSSPRNGEASLVTDGSKEANDDDVLELHRGRQHVQIDLGASQPVFAIVVWLDHRYYQIVHDVVVQLADDADFTQNVRTLFNNDMDNSAGLGAGKDKEYFETREGKLINAQGATGRYLRCYTQGTSESPTSNNFTEIEVYGLSAK